LTEDEDDVTNLVVEAVAEQELAMLEAEEKRIVPPEVPTNCCMSGCVHCTWDIYQDEMEAYQTTRKEIARRRRDLLEKWGRKKEAAAVQEPVFTPAESMDPSMAAFLELEKKLNG